MRHRYFIYLFKNYFLRFFFTAASEIPAVIRIAGNAIAAPHPLLASFPAPVLNSEEDSDASSVGSVVSSFLSFLLVSSFLLLVLFDPPGAVVAFSVSLSVLVFALAPSRTGSQK